MYKLDKKLTYLMGGSCKSSSFKFTKDLDPKLYQTDKILTPLDGLFKSLSLRFIVAHKRSQPTATKNETKACELMAYGVDKSRQGTGV
uniref:Uncharacterized protein n=1 Tax=Romanomermis culicivorax TaxID=13658 RepID=A0A915KGL0_ROMCU